MSRSWIPVFILSHCFLIGCSRTPGTLQGNVAVVDLDEVANQLGLGEQWSSELSARQSTVNQQLADFQRKLNEQLQMKRSEVVTANGLSASLPEEQQGQLVSYQQELNEKLHSAQTEAQKHLNDQRTRIIQNFRRQAEQVSAEVARQRGFDVVLTKNDSVVLSFTPAADITQDVAERLQGRLEAGDFRPQAKEVPNL